jgi:hypothetical protein
VKRACAGDDMDWLKEADERRSKLVKKDQKFERKSAKTKAEREALAKLKVLNPVSDIDSVLGTEDEIPETDPDVQDFKVHSRVEPSKVVKNSAVLVNFQQDLLLHQSL